VQLLSVRRQVGVAAGVAFAALLGLAACAETDRPPTESDLIEIGSRYVVDTTYRRALLEASLVDPTNGYAQRRLAEYAVTDRFAAPTGWDARPVWNPAVAKWRGDETTLQAAAPVLTGGSATHDALLELGRRAFEEYPAQRLAGADVAAQSATSAGQFGLWVADDGWVGGLVSVTSPTGQAPYLAATCATCHARVEHGALVHGVANQALDLGALFARNAADASSYERLLRWGPGRVDVTPLADDPAAISDLRPIARQHRLHWAGTLHQSFGALLVRVETLLITSSATHRPPRELVFALTYYLWHLEASAARAPDDAHAAGAAVFAADCAGCHGFDGRPVRAVPIDAPGTNRVLAESPDRGTGEWRVPSLWGVGTRGRLLHDLSAEDLHDLLDPMRQARAPGHAFGSQRSVAERDALVAFLETLGVPPSGASPPAAPPSR
jgi:mono/diheme cytochrome c family protein